MADNFVMEERNELMVSPTGGGECFGTAHFLTPTTTSAAPPPDSSSFAAAHDSAAKYKDLPLKVNFRGWRTRLKDWIAWVNQMSALHRSTWEKSGIFDAIMSSRYGIYRNDDLIFVFAEKWCPATNSFVFPWGEATITLEDVMVLGGYSVLGEFVLSSDEIGEMEEILEKLQSARSDVTKSSANKADQSKWMTKFMGSQSDIEHEAFLAFWLSRFVFPLTWGTIGRSILPIAVRLARGIKVALAPTVLASLYKNLTSLRAAIMAAKECGTNASDISASDVIITAPLALVQAWIWERFPPLRPNPKFIGETEPRLARWHNVKARGVDEILHKVNSGAEDFQWRPYVMCSSSVFHRKIYKDDGYGALVGPNFNEDLEALVRCMRQSDLVGLEGGCIERYLPHRVAMQFGFDQDIPGHVEHDRLSPEVAWSHYCRPVRDTKLYIPPCVTLPRVTTRYLDWWRGINAKVKKELSGSPFSSAPNDRAEVVSSKKGSSKCLKGKNILKNNGSVSPPPGFARKHKDLSGSPFSSTANIGAEVVSSEKGSSKCLKSEGVSKNNGSVSPHPGFARKHSSVKENASGVGMKEKGAEVSSSGSCRNNLLQECGQNTEVNPSSVRSSTDDELLLGLEERIRNVEELCHLIKAGKLDMLREIGKQLERKTHKEN